ncbi:MAG: class I SAM-dependent methyltransferase [Alphaproteobacteria bacterium]|nr:class I SAM-dependent methyltransferase [Alphaproteobacteria bacterium]MBL7099793.1 class I SAM-dependent methyltransferase [Alphaproteobacteria bacterium]
MAQPVETASRYSDGTYLLHNPDWHAEHSGWKADHIARLMVKNGISPTSVAEVGCGAGGILEALQTAFPTATYFGYDISQQANELARPKANDKLTFHLGDILAAPKIYFDVLLAIDVFEHVDDYMDFLRKLRQLANYKVFHIPLDLSVLSIVRPSSLMNAREAAGHLHYFTKETALATLKDCGYTVVDQCFTRRSVELRANSLGASLMKIPRAGLSFMSNDLAARFLGGFSLLVLAK